MGIVLKYGGTSLSSINQIKDIAKYIKKLKEKERKVVVVVSAMGKTTDYLISLAKKITSDIPPRELDTLLSTGEQQTIALLTMALKNNRVDAVSLTGQQAGLITTKSHTKGIIRDVRAERVITHLNNNQVVVVAGFQGISAEGDITTLGRGGSDTSAVAIAAKLGFKCHIYTDVKGIYTVDPRVYKQAKQIKEISYIETMEMSALGTSVLETRSVELAKKYNVKLYLAASLSQEGSGTYIMNKEYLFEEKPITGISVTDNVVMITLEGESHMLKNLSNLFKKVSEENINLDMISQNTDKENNLVLSFSIDYDDLTIFNQLIKNTETLDEFMIESKTDLIKISLVGVGMASHFGIASRVFSTLSKANISYYHVSTSEISISCTVDKVSKEKAIEKLAKEFDL
ncbi:MAG: aspartate kinase [Candidatus Izimaplasma sp.]|nr:aspartate kinase [Candidatus Izimaplasma bacterium]